MGAFLRSRWQVLLIWAHVGIGRAWLPVLLAGVEFVILAKVPQSREVLFSLFESFKDANSASIFASSSGFALLTFVAMAAVLSSVLWYSARLLCTVDREHVVRPHLSSAVARRAYRQACTWIPRWLGTGALALVVTSTIVAGVFPGEQSGLVLLGCAMVPMVIAALAQVALSPGRRRRIRPRSFVGVLWLIALLEGLLLIVMMALRALGAGFSNLSTLTAVLFLCALPALFHVALIERRRMLPRRSGAGRPLAPASPRRLGEVHGRVLAIAASMTGALVLRAWTPQWDWLSSPSLVLIFLGVVVSVGTLAILWISRLTRWTPGIGWATTLLVVGLLVSAVLREPLGVERLGPAATTATGADVPASPPAQPAPSARGVYLVNAHGGGLRAAYFTATVLTRLDDLSCGRFGKRLSVASGVSGGSLGLATYLLVRQDRVRRGVWAGCVPGDIATMFGAVPSSQDQVDKILLNDFLSPVMANFLSTDLVPWMRVRRGQALLDGWEEGARAGLGDGAITFSAPLASLAGEPGVDRAPSGVNRLVIFNATDVSTGKRFEINSAQSEQCGHVMSIGEAVLHGARFPFVTPAGECVSADRGVHALVDGGYYDNSGAEALLSHVGSSERTVWLNIDGNPPENECVDVAPEASPGMWSAASTLLASRRGHAAQAQERMGGLLRPTRDQAIDLKLSLDVAFSGVIKDPRARCHFVRTLRSAPLGWYLTRATAEAMHSSAFAEAGKVCRATPELCRKGE